MDATGTGCVSRSWTAPRDLATAVAASNEIGAQIRLTGARSGSRIACLLFEPGEDLSASGNTCSLVGVAFLDAGRGAQAFDAVVAAFRRERLALAAEKHATAGPRCLGSIPSTASMVSMLIGRNRTAPPCASRVGLFR
jgi:hypothetical protein